MLPHRGTMTTKRRNWLFPLFLPPFRTQFTLGMVLICLIVIGTMGALTAAAQVTNPGNPLYPIKQLIQGVQQPQAPSAVAQAEANWRAAHDQLKALVSLADPAHPADYQQALMKLDQQINALAQSIQALPAGQDRNNLSNKLEALKADARQMLRGLLSRLTLSEKQLTTDELGRLEDTIPRVESAVMIVSSHSKKQTTINIVGENLQPGARLLIDNQLVVSSGSLQNGKDIFIVSWSSQQPPKTIGILDPDGTMAQTTTITFTIASTNKSGNGKNESSNKPDTSSSANSNGNGNGNGNSNSNGNGNKNSNSNCNSNSNSHGNGNSNSNCNNK
jgi:hypothetical protein